MAERDRINIAAELASLRQDFDALLSGFPNRLGSVSTAISERLRVKRSADDPHWIAQFSPLTVLYPLLQAQCCPRCSLEDARTATRAHFCLVVHAFIEDRIEDQQVRLAEDERAFSDHVLQIGLSLLGELRSGRHRADTGEPLYRELFSVSEIGGTNESALRCIAPKKASYGFLATHALLRGYGCAARELEAVARAFDHIATALQYADDAEDWREDLALRDDNLLLARLVDIGLDPYNLPENDYRIPNIGHALLRQNVLAHVQSQVDRHLDAAIHIQKGLGCETLVGLIEELKGNVSESIPRMTARITSEVLVACLLVQTSSA